MTTNGRGLEDAFSGSAADAAEAPEALPEGNDGGRPASREGRKAVVVHLDRLGYRTLRILGIDQEMPLQRMMIEAIDDYLEKHDLPRCANGMAQPAAE